MTKSKLRDQTWLIRNMVSFTHEYAELLRSFDAAEGALGFRTAERRILETMVFRRQTQSDLRAKLNMDRGQISRSIQSLLAKEYIKIVSDHTSSRHVEYTLDMAGIRQLLRSSNSIEKAISEVLSNWSPAKQAAFLAAVRALGRNRPEAEDPSSEELIRPAEKGEFGRIADAFINDRVHRYHRFDGSVEPWALKLLGDCAAAIDSNESAAIVMSCDQRIAGTVICFFGGDGNASIHLLWVLMGYDGLGRGSLLVERAVNQARALGCHSISGKVFGPDDGPCIYERLGWTLADKSQQLIFGRPAEIQKWSTTL